jgi:plastocyanin
VLSFDKTELLVPAGVPIKLTFDNQQSGVPHNVHIRQGSETVFPGPDITGVAEIVYDVPPLTAGEYTYLCTIHPPMTGTLTAK